MTRKEESLVRKIEQAGIKKSIKEGHSLSQEQLMELKIQIVPRIWRMVTALLGLLWAAIARQCFIAGASGWGLMWSFAALVCFVFALFGVRQTIETVVESMGDVTSQTVIDLAIKGIRTAVKAIFSNG